MKTLLNTTIKEEDKDRGMPYYARQLENGDTLKAMVDEAVAMLSPCAHCGREHPRILYHYLPTTFHTGNPTGRHPHELYAICTKDMEDTVKGICEMESKRWYASDDEEDFREALRRIVQAWNRRPSCDK